MLVPNLNGSSAFDIFEQLLELPADKMMHNVNSFEGIDSSVIEEVKSLIQAHLLNKRDMFLSSLISQSAKSALGYDELLHLSGVVIEGFELTALLGEGGQGVVYKAIRCDGKFDQTVAVKLLYPAFNMPKEAIAISVEAQSLAKLNHGSIARVFTIGQHHDYCYMIMDFINGESLDTFFANYALTLDDMLELFFKILSALAHAHDQGIVHADIKPSNILVDMDKRPVLLDFGISKHLVDMPAILAPEVQGFTPNFSSPEQRNGEAVGVSSDVYSAAKMLNTLMLKRFSDAELRVRLLSLVFKQAYLEDVKVRTPDVESLQNMLISAMHFQVPKEINISLVDKLKCIVYRYKYLLVSFVLTLPVLFTVLNVLSTKNAELAQQKNENDKAIDYLERLFEAHENNGEFFDILNSSTESGHLETVSEDEEQVYSKLFSEHVFTNHGGKIREPIALKVVGKGNHVSDLAFKVTGPGYVSNEGYYRHTFTQVGIHTVTIEAQKHGLGYDKLVLRFVIRDGHGLPIQFKDVPATHPHYNNIHYLAMRGVVIGRPDKGDGGRIFQPQQVAKQAEALSILFLSAHQKGVITLTKTSHHFHNLRLVNDKGDIEDFTWANAYLVYGNKAGFMPYPEQFDPKKPVSKEWLAMIVSQLLELYDPDGVDSFSHYGFSDSTEFNSDQSLRYGQLCAFYQLCDVHGSQFQPKRAMTRGEVANIGAKILQMTMHANASVN
ncbi:serine/threonine protein kinase [Pseudoalteromonas umbrosa]|uniref:serine/threonine protein kinase n=1 Tax=Pseudoalteromonas umbrosa TaxID=3048489 RepID=UPI0024C37CCB|nr:serine/threonine protein kinase [Pseudoalteromonas sp. B95]MDK1286777.1 serine/threonine protein kinase [Pseudoalteromonas sp. B95]